MLCLTEATASAAVGCAQLNRGSNIDPGQASMANGPLDVFQVSSAGNVFRTQVDPRTNGVNSAENLGGVSRSEPGAVSWGPGHSAVFVRGADDALYFTQFENGVSSGWQNLGGVITWNPHAVSTGPGISSSSIEARTSSCGSGSTRTVPGVRTPASAAC